MLRRKIPPKTGDSVPVEKPNLLPPPETPRNEMVVADTEKKFRTLERALGMLATEKETNLAKTLKSRELGLGLVLAGVTELQAHRLSNLHRALIDIETRVLDPLSISRMDATSLVTFYKLVSANAESASRFVFELSKSINWDKLREALIEFEAQEYTQDKDNGDLQEVASQLLKRVIETRQDS